MARSREAAPVTAASRLSTPTARSHERLTHIGAPSAAAIQAGSRRASMNAARRAAVGRPVSAPAIGESRSQARRPAARPSTETPPCRPRASNAHGSPRSNRPVRRRACSGSAAARASTTAWVSACETPSTAAQAARLSSPVIRLARPSSMATRAVSKASAEAWDARARRSAAASRAARAAARASPVRLVAQADSTAKIARHTAPAVAARIRYCGLIQPLSESHPATR